MTNNSEKLTSFADRFCFSHGWLDPESWRHLDETDAANKPFWDRLFSMMKAFVDAGNDFQLTRVKLHLNPKNDLACVETSWEGPAERVSDVDVESLGENVVKFEVKFPKLQFVTLRENTTPTKSCFLGFDLGLANYSFDSFEPQPNEVETPYKVQYKTAGWSRVNDNTLRFYFAPKESEPRRQDFELTPDFEVAYSFEVPEENLIYKK